MRAPVDIYNHNIETVPSLYRKCRPGGHYQLSLEVLDHAKRAASAAGRALLTKTGFMLGLGEEPRVDECAHDLRSRDCDILTLGHLPPAEFAGLRRDALALGFRHVEAGPLVRCSYHGGSI
ncbi:MAG: hypothetical protein JOZ29_17515 [Deltaproteobacteria bacterium]|nr:hypothetical protein [Deltaproteobacteria bacterium]